MLGCFSIGDFRPAHLRIGTFRPEMFLPKQIFALGFFSPTKFRSQDISVPGDFDRSFLLGRVGRVGVGREGVGLDGWMAGVGWVGWGRVG